MPTSTRSTSRTSSVSAGRRTDFVFDADLTAFAETVIGRTHHSMAAVLDADHDSSAVTIPRAHHRPATITAGQQQVPLGPGQALVLPPHTAYRVAWDTLDSETTILDQQLLDDIAAGLRDTSPIRPTGPVRFSFGAAVSPAADQTWRQTTRLVRRVARANAANPDGALLAGELARLLATTALVCFPNSTMRDTHPTRLRTTPASLRRAIAYIGAHLDQPLTLTGIADAARVSPRALNLTFNRHHGLSPMGYARRARLDRAHHDLEAARPGDGTTVTAIAARWGFHSLPRFGVTYRQTYGQPPSHTLRGNRA